MQSRGREPVFSGGHREKRISKAEFAHLGVPLEGHRALLQFRSRRDAQRQRRVVLPAAKVCCLGDKGSCRVLEGRAGRGVRQPANRQFEVESDGAGVFGSFCAMQDVSSGLKTIPGGSQMSEIKKSDPCLTVHFDHFTGSFLKRLPSCITKWTCSRVLMSFNGSPETAITSA